MPPLDFLAEFEPQDGPTHMARDRAMLERAKGGEAVIRIYRWQEQWVSLGAHQAPLEGVTRQVHRPTGGRAVLHGDDVTISMAVPLPLGDFGHFQLRPIYSALMDPVIEALIACDLPAQSGAHIVRNNSDDLSGVSEDRLRSEDCFATTGRFDLCLQGTSTKVGGAALYTCETAALLQASVLMKDSEAFAMFPRRCVPFWRSSQLTEALINAFQSRGWQPRRIPELLYSLE